jgi:predicted DCC family thiol-disulfide oxidoreductase YuxK
VKALKNLKKYEEGDRVTKEIHSKHEHYPDIAHSIVLFDGVCRFCNGWVQFLIRHDKSDRFRFSPIQSDFAQSFLSSHNPDQPLPDSVILAEQGIVYTQSAAVLRIFKRLGGGWALLYMFIVIPGPIRDAIYQYMAKRRYRLFGKYDSCMLPTESVKRKFLG